MRKLTFLFIILALVTSTTVVNAANMQDCPSSMISSDMAMDTPCHEDMSSKNDQNCENMCKSYCAISAVSTILSATSSDDFFKHALDKFDASPQRFTSIYPEALYYPPIVTS